MFRSFVWIQFLHPMLLDAGLNCKNMDSKED
jgi:hypothetical protein